MPAFFVGVAKKNATFATMKRLFPIGLLLFVVLVAACSKRETPPPPEEDLLYRVECFFPNHPDSALQILDTLNLSVLSEKERAHYCLVRMWVKELMDQYDSEVDSLLQVAEDYFVGGQDKYYETMTLLSLARLNLFKGGTRQTVLDYRQKAMQSIELCQHVDERLLRYSEPPISEQEKIDKVKYAIHQKLGMSYGSTGYHKESIEHMKAAQKYYAETQNHKQYMVCTFPLGMSYLALEEYDSCLVCFQNGLHDAQIYGSINDCAFYYSCLSIYCMQRVEKQAFSNEEEREGLLRRMIAESRKGLALLGDTIESNYKKGLVENLAEAYYELHQYDSCIYFGTQAYEMPDLHEQGGLLYKWLFYSYRALGDNDKASFFAEKLIVAQQEENENQQSVAEVKGEYEKQMEINKVQAEQQIRRYRLYLWIALLLAVLLAVVVLVLRYRKAKELEVLRSREAQQKLQLELDHAAQHSMQLLQQRALAIYQSDQDEKLKRILDAFDSAYPQAMDNLKKDHPDLSETECQLALLNLLRFRSKEEADLLGLSENTIRKYRSNLRKKLDSDAFSTLGG